MNKRKLEDILDKLQIKINLFGYKYWITAVELYFKDNTVGMWKICKEIAKKYNTTPSRVDRALRHARERKEEIIQRYFNVNYDIDNSAFLALLAREMEREEC